MKNSELGRRKLTIKQERGLCRDYVRYEDATLKSVAVKYGISKSLASNILKRHDVAVKARPSHRKGKTSVSSEIQKALCAAYLSDTEPSTNKLAEVYGMCAGTVMNVLKRNGIETKPRRATSTSFKKRTPDDQAIQIIRLWELGNSSKRVAKDMSADRFEVLRVLLQHTSADDKRLRKAAIATIRSGVGVAQYSTWLETRNIRKGLLVGRCDICGNKRPLHVDHCHTSGVIRGLLCSTCNCGLGYFGDSAPTIRNAATYLESRCFFQEGDG